MALTEAEREVMDRELRGKVSYELSQGNLGAALAAISAFREACELSEREASAMQLTHFKGRVKELELIVEKEQAAWKAVQNRLCKAMGTWEGSWIDAVETRLKGRASE